MENLQKSDRLNIPVVDLNSKSLVLAGNVHSICKPLFKKYRVSGFSYSRVFQDGSRSELWNKADALYHTFLRKKYIADTYTPDNYNDDERYIFLSEKIKNCPDEVNRKYTKQLLDQKELFNNDNCFMIVSKNVKLCEYFIFYTPPDYKSAVNFYLNHIDELENFAKNFKEESRTLIEMADEERIIKPWRYGNLDSSSKSLSTPRKRLDINADIKLTKREIQVAHLMIEGKTAKESASYLDISTRTVESYIENIKDKLACNRKGDLIMKLIKSELISR